MNTGYVKRFSLRKPRKASYRFLLVYDADNVFLVTMDRRRRKNVITGTRPVFSYQTRKRQLQYARMCGCHYIVRVKTLKPEMMGNPNG